MPTAPPASVVRSLRAAGCVFAEEEAALLVEAADGPRELADLVARRVAGQPLEHVVGWAAFAGLRVAVGPGVFVPRRRSELLASLAVARARETADLTGRRPVVVDLCCGVGALGLAVAERVDVRLVASDLDPVAVGWARTNLGDRGEVCTGDLYDGLPAGLRGRVDVLVANVPYVPSQEVVLLPAEARLHEPRGALDGGPDGLRVLARVAREATDWLAPGGWLLSETSARQAETACRLLADAGLLPGLEVDDELGATVVVGHSRAETRPAP